MVLLIFKPATLRRIAEVSNIMRVGTERLPERMGIPEGFAGGLQMRLNGQLPG